MQDAKLWSEKILSKIESKMSAVRDRNFGKIPYSTDANGRYEDMSAPEKQTEWDALSWWTNGFWGGLMWLLYLDTKEEAYADAARKNEEQLDVCLSSFYGLHHDVGFMYLPTAAADYRITGNEDARRRALHAASLLAGRFNLAGGFIRAWNGGSETTGRAIIDCMMNLNLLYWASEEDGDPRFGQIAQAHADMAAGNFVREDGSVRHIVDFDPETGRFVKDEGGQGYAQGTSWTRGQAWAVYGFTTSYLHAGEIRYLKTARSVADYCISQIPESGILPIDFRQPAEPAYEDSCGAVILASGLLELADALRRGDRLRTEQEVLDAETYEAAARKLLKAIAETRADYSDSRDAIVQNCSAAYHDKRHHFPMVYADYFFVEALLKMKGMEFRMW